jgi:hypothetical protein
LGRFITRDPIGYEGNSLNLYGYVHGNPVAGRDPDGLILDSKFEFGPPPRRPILSDAAQKPAPKPKCGREIGHYLDGLTALLPKHFAKLSNAKRKKICGSLNSGKGWDIQELSLAGMAPGGVDVFGGEKGLCAGTVTVHGKCYWAAEVNYFLFGMISRLCHEDAKVMPGHYILANTKAEGKACLTFYRNWQYFGRYLEFLPSRTPPPRRFAGPGVWNRFAWMDAGWDGRADSVTSGIVRRCDPCNVPFTGFLTVQIGNYAQGVSSSSIFTVTSEDVESYR